MAQDLLKKLLLHLYIHKITNMGTNQLAEEIEISMNRGVFHPNLLKSNINSSGCQCNASRNASLLTFHGFDFMFNCDLILVK